MHVGPCKITFEIQGLTLVFSFYVTKLRKNWEIQFETVHQIALSCMCYIVFTEVDSNFCKQKAAKTAVFVMVREYIKNTAGNSEIPHYYNALLRLGHSASFC